MLPPRSAVSRIPALARSWRPHNISPRSVSHHQLQLRPFNTKPPLLLLSPPLGRPQLPFLAPQTHNRPLPPLSVHLRQHFGRLISTERRDYYKRRLSRGFRIGVTFYAILVLFQVIKLGVYQEQLEHSWPTPQEWTWKSRWCLRSAHAQQHPEQIGKLLTSWPMVAGYLRELIGRLEDIEGEGKGIVEQEDGGFLIEGVGKTGFDITAKSEPWRRGYFDALIGSARAAENLEGWMTDRKQRISAPAEYVVGPSNPRPKPMPAGEKKVPREEDSEPASPSPEVFYVKILTTKGFTTRQKLDAALAYADWLDYKGLQQTARDMYTWAMDIAVSGLPPSSNANNEVVDTRTGILHTADKTLPSENIIRVSTALAVHKARHGDLTSALSIFTSVLKTRRSLPQPAPGTVLPLPPSPPPNKINNTIFAAFFESIRIMFVPSEFPAPPASGNDPPQRTKDTICEEAGLMTYIGEILFASSSREAGLAWTRDAVDMAESALWELSRAGADSDTRQKCAQCLKTGLENWKTMVQKLVARAEKDEEEGVLKAKTAWWGGAKQLQAKTLERKRWQAEEMILDDRIRSLWPVVVGESALDGLAPGSSLFL
ncbi:hypothetical protein ASPZODRAFT_123733 [Penicilliopsis zonata CBS 506.65]|uniref:MFS maltose permease n=1 Tax=Penicilliopsis zonata CBS 506.65 TaxID=1073090 RepID=A0A1L9S8F3_9EURO|nr:hypothetical protein ASPZODRAFT_123733 [Penicilliopsis zonata CBS 506.65]OJJ43441.1 hypothetical protein ASPZODRAFT_123733 [Penicilliopsis zonata CBS 506.65]